MILVSCIMPARGRAEWTRLAIDCFLAQTYHNKELLILDDADLRAIDGSCMDGIRYFVNTERQSITEKRNQLCEFVKGTVVAHWDSDDWSAPERLAEQLKTLEASGKSVTGYYGMYFYAPDSQRCARYSGALNYALGTSLMYTRDWWRSHPFERPKKKEYGEDNIFVRKADKEKQLASVSGLGMMVARAHKGNTSQKHLAQYKKATIADLPHGFPR